MLIASLLIIIAYPVVCYINKKLTQKIMSAVCRSAWEMGCGREPQNGKGVGTGDLHFWLEDKEGNIIDPTPPAYSGMKIHYRVFQHDKKKFFDYWWGEWKKMPKAQKEQLYKNPVARRCMFNVFAYWKKHKDCKICIGSQGFEFEAGKIFWEFG